MALCALPMEAAAQVALPAVTPCAGAEAPHPRADSASALAVAAAGDSARAPARGAPDVILLASFSADQIRFNSQPRAKIRFCWGTDTLRIVERRNLPDPVVPGVTYRNVFIAMELLTHLDGVCVADRITSSGSPTEKRDCGALSLNARVRTDSTRPPP